MYNNGNILYYRHHRAVINRRLLRVIAAGVTKRHRRRLRGDVIGIFSVGMEKKKKLVVVQ